MTAIICGLLSAAFYGAADFMGGVAARRAPMIAVTALSQSTGLLVLLCIVPFTYVPASASEIAWSAAGGVCGGIGIALLYHALSIGKMGVVSPITAVLAAALPVGVGVARGDLLHWPQLAGIGLALVAVVLISLSKEETGQREIATTGAKEAIASGIFIGLFFLALGIARRGAGLDTLLWARIGSVIFLFAVAGIARTQFKFEGKTLGIVAGSGAIDMTANVLFVLAAQTGELAIAAVLSSLYPASTVFLARIALNERLQLVQKIGVGLALAGVMLIAFKRS